MTEHIKTKRSGAIQTVQICRPDKKNALNLAMYQHLAQVCFEADQDPSVRVLLLYGEETCFCAGNDLNDFISADFGARWHESPVYQFMLALSGLSKPVVVAVQGPAIGIGSTLLLHCDFVFASENATFQFPFVSLGLCPEFASSLLLPEIVGSRKSKEWLLLGKTIAAEEALQAGFINEISPKPLALAMETAEAMIALPEKALLETKTLIGTFDRAGVQEAIDAEAQVFLKALQGEEFKRAMADFLTRSKGGQFDAK